MVRAGTDRPSPAFRSPDVGRRPESGAEAPQSIFSTPSPDSIRATKAIAALIDGQFVDKLKGHYGSGGH